MTPEPQVGQWFVSVDGQVDWPFDTLEEAKAFVKRMRASGDDLGLSFEYQIAYRRGVDGKNT